MFDKCLLIPLFEMLSLSFQHLPPEYQPHFIHHNQGRQSVPKSGRSERGGARNFGVYQTIAPKNLLFKGYFCPEQGLSALNFRGGAEKVVVHMHWLTWLVWRL